MKISRARKRQLAAAREAARRKREVAPPTSIRKVNGSQLLVPVEKQPPQRFSPVKRLVDEPYLVPHPPQRRRKLFSNDSHSSPQKCVSSPLHEGSGDITALEKKYMAVIEYVRAKAVGTRKNVPKGMVEGIIAKYGLSVEPRQFMNMVRRCMDGVGLQRKKGSGRKVKYGSDVMFEWLRETIWKRCGLVTVSELAVLFKEHFGGGSYYTVWKMLRRIGCHSTVRLVKPSLTEAHKKRRYEWARECIAREKPFGEARDMLVHVDEKWFYTQHLRWKALHFPGMARPTLTVHSKRHIPKLMFIGAVACPKPEYSFDGNLGCFLVGRKAKKANCSRYVPITMNTSVFIKFMTKKIIPQILRKGREWVKRVVIQFDNAGGHGGGSGDIGATIRKLQEWVNTHQRKLKKIMKKRPVPVFYFVAQPPKSPDLNVLDLGVWNSVQVAVKEPFQLPRDGPWKDRLVKEVLRAWDEKCTADMLGRVFETLQHIWQEVYEAKGSNMFNIPHFRK